MPAVSLLTSQKFIVVVNVLAILSFPLSIFFWWDSRAIPEINFFSSSIQPAIVLREQLTGDLKLDGEPLKGNVYAVRLFIWNS